MRKLLWVIILVFSMSTASQNIRVATFNVSMEATNYLQQGKLPIGNELSEKLEHGKNLQIKNIAEIIQRINPDIILLNEFESHQIDFNFYLSSNSRACLANAVN